MVRERQQESSKISDLAARLRKARELLAITQEKLGVSWGKTGNYIYMLEAGVKKFPQKLEHKVIELEGEVRRKLYSPEAVTHAISLREPDEKSQSLVGAPVVSWASAGGGGNFSDLANHIDETVMTDCLDPNRYALIVEGDSMQPKMEAGDRIIVAPNSSPRNGDIVVARLSATGEAFLKLYHEAHGKVRLSSFNPAYPTMEYPRKDFRFVQPVYALVRKMKRV